MSFLTDAGGVREDCWKREGGPHVGLDELRRSFVHVGLSQRHKRTTAQPGPLLNDSGVLVFFIHRSPNTRSHFYN